MCSLKDNCKIIDSVLDEIFRFLDKSKFSDCFFPRFYLAVSLRIKSIERERH